MKKTLCILAFLFLIFQVSFSQNPTKPGVKKIVTSKITKDPKTGKVMKTITTTTVTDVILVDGIKPSTVTTKPAAVVKKQTPSTAVDTKVTKSKVTKTPYKKPITKPIQKAVIVQKPIVKAPTETKATNNNTSKIKVEAPADDEVDVKTFNESKVEVPVNKPVPVKTTPGQTYKAPIKTDTKKKLAPNSNTIHIGIRGGINYATLQNVESLSSITNPSDLTKLKGMGGIFMNFGVTKRFSIQPEVNYSVQGYALTNGIDESILNNTAINIPVLMKYSIGKSKIKYFINTGPYIGMLLKSEKTDLKGNILTKTNINFDSEVNQEIKTNRMDFGLQAGTGFQFNLGGPKLEIEARYLFGLADPKKYTTTKPSYIGETGRNRIWTGTIGLLFPVGK